MKFSESWLRSIIDPGMSSEALSHLLTMAGLEVEAREPVAPAFDHVVIGEVTAIEPHPDADRLKICRVDADGSVLQIVCGAQNVAPGMRVPCALVGAKLPGMTVTEANVRGIPSSGMLCSARELGLGEDHSGVLELEPDAPVGADLRRHLDLDDHVFTLKLTPNRGDCLSLRGLAREVAALTGAQYQWPADTMSPVIAPDQRSIVLNAGDACPRYCGRAIVQVTAQASTPPWMVRRLQRSGIRPISAIVDITNYVMLELGQPLHAFDLGRLNGSVQVRFARAGERLKLLDGREVELDASNLVIADERDALALAGVMGGDACAVSDATTSVFLESAFFAPEIVARSSRGLGIASDAAHRFERGVDFAIARTAIERASQLILEICGGQAGPISEACGTLPERKAIMLRPERVERILGVRIDAAEITRILQLLGLTVQPRDSVLLATAPSYRFDLEIEEDLIEEIARVHGYECIPASLPLARSPMLPVPEGVVSTDALKQALAARGYFEVVTFSFVDRALEADFSAQSDPVALANPLAQQMGVMRSTLLGSLVECVRFNVARKQERVRLFEVAACFGRDAGAYRQVERVAGISFGGAKPEQWGERPRDVDFFDIRGDLEAVLNPVQLTFVAAVHPAFHPGQSARILVAGKPAGWAGSVHPRWLQKYQLGAAAVAFELDLAAVRQRDLPAYLALTRFPPVRRDLALVVDATASVADLHAAILASGGRLVTEVTLFDVYAGKGLGEGRKSLAFRVLLQDTEKTLTDVKVEEAIQRIVAFVKEKHNATLRT